jgi:hypothetical protein
LWDETEEKKGPTKIEEIDGISRDSNSRPCASVIFGILNILAFMRQDIQHNNILHNDINVEELCTGDILTGDISGT